MRIDGRRIGPGEPCYVIAEMSANHIKNFDRACAIVLAAKDAGADAIKLQTYTADTLTIDCGNKHFLLTDHPLWAGKTLHELYDGAFTPWEWHAPLKRVAQEVGITLFSTPFDETAVDYLEALGVPAHKVASFEMVDIPLLEKVASTGKPVILSAGMATREEIRLAIRTLGQGGAGDLALLKCNSNYPSDPAEMNLRTIADMARRFKLPIGLSDHTRNTATAVTAVALGACIVERHFTIPGGESSPDAAFSLLPDEFRRMVDDIRIAEQSLGKVFYGRTAGEERSLRFRRSLFIVQDVRRGETLTPENLRVIRPGDGLPPVHYRELLGRTVTRDLSRGTPLAWDMVQGRRGSRQA